MARPDGRLNHNLLDEDPLPQDECGVIGVWAPGEEVSKLAYYGLYALQHRGQESAGIATSDGKHIKVYKDVGLVSQVFDESTLRALTGHIALGHCRYSTTGGNQWSNGQPTLGATPHGTVALGHNGNLTNSADLYDRIVEFLISAFAEGKFVSTLAFLFGLGFVWQGMRAEERGESSGKLLLKRVSVLSLFGLVHAVFVWSGDILLAYGLMGFVLVL